jgi:hypothetical protein
MEEAAHLDSESKEHFRGERAAALHAIMMALSPLEAAAVMSAPAAPPRTAAPPGALSARDGGCRW